MTAYASNVTIRIAPRHGAVLVGVLSGFPQRREGGEISVHVPDMYLQEHKDLLVDFRLPECPLGSSSDDEETSESMFSCVAKALRLPRGRGGGRSAHFQLLGMKMFLLKFLLVSNSQLLRLLVTRNQLLGRSARQCGADLPSSL